MPSERPAPRHSDLNQLPTPHPFDPRQDVGWKDYSTATADGAVRVYFRDLEARLVEHIRAADYVLGSVFVLTSFPVLRALRRTRGVSIVVQKQRQLRTDYRGDRWEFYRDLRRAYYGLPSFPRRWLRGPLSRLRPYPYVTAAYETEAIAQRGIPEALFPVQCVGYGDAADYKPLAHSKFFLFCRKDEEKQCLVPYEVWTGSYNPTRNARHSIENVVVIRSPEILRAYFLQYSQVAARSEPLEWDSEHPSPTLVADAQAHLDEMRRRDDEFWEKELEAEMRRHAEHPCPDPREEELDELDDLLFDDADPGEEGLDDWRQDERRWL